MASSLADSDPRRAGFARLCGVITVVDYDPVWPRTFEALRRRYEVALKGVTIVAIEHVGSTSVPGLAAKPVIDVDIVVAREYLAATIAAMELAGIPLARRTRDPRPLGARRAQRAASNQHLRRRRRQPRDAQPPRRADRPARGRPLRDQYASLKRSIAARVDDIDTYVEAKSTFLSTVLGRAGLSSEERRIIEDVNRVDLTTGSGSLWVGSRSPTLDGDTYGERPVSNSSSEDQRHARAQ